MLNSNSLTSMVKNWEKIPKITKINAKIVKQKAKLLSIHFYMSAFFCFLLKSIFSGTGIGVFYLCLQSHIYPLIVFIDFFIAGLKHFFVRVFFARKVALNHQSRLWLGCVIMRTCCRSAQICYLIE